MPHDTKLVALLAVGFVLAFGFGYAASRLRMPPLVGYLVAGILIGPFTPGFVGDTATALELAEVGVMLLMFGVGMHFSIRDLLAVRRVAVPGALVQIVGATALGAVVAHYGFGWPLGSGIIYGLCLSVASTVVLLRTLESRGRLVSLEGQIAVGWLIMEDVITILVLVLLPALAPHLGGAPLAGQEAAPGVLLVLGMTIGKAALFVALMLVAGVRIFPVILARAEATGSRELFTLAVVALAMGIAFAASSVFGLSPALGAFFAGVVIHESDLSHHAADDSRPLQDVFSALFFIAAGMLFDPAILAQKPWHVLATVLIIVVGKSIAALGIVLVLGAGRRTALVVSAALAQIGEFSFMLAGLGLSLGLLAPEGLSLVVAGSLISIVLNPFIFAAADRVEARRAVEPSVEVA